MRCSPNLLAPVMALVTCVAVLAQGPTYKLGRTASKEEIRAWDTAISLDGKGLPPGNGTAKEGAKHYTRLCAQCHGPTGEEGKPSQPGGGGPPRLVGGQGTLTAVDDPIRTVGSFWPFATTIWMYINRAMPPDKAGLLSADEVYALTAWLLYRNGVIKESDIIDAKSLPKVQMPNWNGFIPSRLEDIPDLRKRGCRLGHCP